MSSSSTATEHLRRHLLELLDGGGAHQSFNPLVGDLPDDLRGAKPQGQSHTPWGLLEHMRRTQHDILEYITDPDHESPPWPEGFWPDEDGPPDAAAWDRAVKRFQDDAGCLRALVEDERTDLLAALPHTDGHTIAREVLVVADHTAYHLGQLATIRKLLGAPVDTLG